MEWKLEKWSPIDRGAALANFSSMGLKVTTEYRHLRSVEIGTDLVA